MLTTIRFAFDLGVLVLIWLVQLVIYPGFRYLPRESMEVWHPQYTVLVSWVVIPLMLGQLGIATYEVLRAATIYTVSAILLIGAAWLLTFFYAVPLHNGIGQAADPQALVERLISVNTIRTVVWTLVFLLSLYRLIRS